MNSFESAIKNIKNKKVSRVYVIYGEESYYSDEIIKALEESLLNPSSKDFNYTKIYGSSSIKAVDIISIIRTYPMMNNYRLVVIKDANKIAEAELSAISNVLVSPPRHSVTVLVFNKLPDRRKKWVKQLLSNAVAINAKPIREREIKKWITFFSKKYKIYLDSLAVETLAEHLPPNINIIENEIKKLKLFCYDKKVGIINQDIIFQFVSTSREESVFALTDYLGEKNLTKAIKVLNSLLSSPNYPPTRILYHLYNFFMHITVIKNSKCQSVDDVLRQFPNLHKFVAQKYLKASKTYDLTQLYRNMELLADYDALVKGINYSSERPEDKLIKLLYDLIV